MKFSGQALLVTDARNKSLLPLVVSGLRSFCGVSQIVLVAPSIDLETLRPVLGISPEIHLLADSDVLEVTIKEIGMYPIPMFPQRAGWFLQQFLKLGFATHPLAKQNYLVWDADTIPLRPMEFCTDGRVIFTQGLEYFEAYFDTIHDLLGLRSVVPHSVISQHGLFHKQAVQELLACVASRRASANFAKSILSSCADRKSAFFSEYETYAAFFAASRPNEFRLVKRKWFRNAAALSGIPPSGKWLRFWSQFFDYASFEAWDTGLHRTVKSLVKLAWVVIFPFSNGLYRKSRPLKPPQSR